jgi:predicted ferric reductase
MSGAVLRLFFYAGFVALPVVLATFLGLESEKFVSELGKNFALMAFLILILQFIMAARTKWIERTFGFDILIRYHKHMAGFAGALLLAAGGGGWRLLIGLDVPWYIWLGKATLVAVLLNIVLSGFQTSIKLKFETWRLGHDIMGPLIILMAFTHSWVAGHDLNLLILKILWIAGLILALAFMFYHGIVRPRHLERRSYRVIDVQPETEDVWTVKMSPPEGEPIYSYLPGQFHFVTFYRNRGLPVEEHHWTVSSSPAEKGYVSSTIKALGDFTSTIGETRAGDRAAVHGAFGRFSYVLHPEEIDQGECEEAANFPLQKHALFCRPPDRGTKKPIDHLSKNTLRKRCGLKRPQHGRRITRAPKKKGRTLYWLFDLYGSCQFSKVLRSRGWIHRGVLM